MPRKEKKRLKKQRYIHTITFNVNAPHPNDAILEKLLSTPYSFSIPTGPAHANGGVFIPTQPGERVVDRLNTTKNK